MSSTAFYSFQEIQEQWLELLTVCPQDTLYLTPQWQEVWWNSFGNGREMAGFYIDGPQGVMAIASLARQNNTVSLLGNSETFDYNDFMIRPGFESAFFLKLFDRLEQEGFSSLELYSLPETSPTLALLPETARQRGYTVEIAGEDVVPGLDLPADWDAYLGGLSRKDRHELRRKLRRLESVDNWRWYCVSDPDQVAAKLDDFLRLMRLGDQEKSAYVTPEREEFFHRITERTAEMGLVKLFFMEMDDATVAASLCFDYGPSRLLYNSGYNPEYSYYSVGLLMNALCLRDAIERGLGYFDFLRGSEPYKYHLGGQNHTLYQIVVKPS